VKYSPLDDYDDNDDDDGGGDNNNNNNNNNELSGAVIHEIFHAVLTYLRRRKHTLGVYLLALPVTTC